MKYLLTILIILYSFGLSAETLVVCPSCSIKSIKTALAKAKNGDKISIKKGVYKEGKIVVNKSVTICGEDFPILDGENDAEIIEVTANNVTIEGLQIQNVGTSYIEDRAGIRLSGVRNFTIKNNKFINTFFGLYMAKSRNGTVYNNVFIGDAKAEMSSGNGIHAWHCKHLQIIKNKVEHHRDGIYFEFVDSSRVDNNRSRFNLRYGLHFMFSNDDIYTNNVFEKNGSGVAVMFSRRINMYKNSFIKNWGSASYGLLLKEIYDAKIERNNFTENTLAIYIEGSTRIEYSYNNFKQNGWAMQMAGGCLDNNIHHNNFIGNTFELGVHSKINNNTFDDNYWSEYSGYDLDRDGVGDVPYRPVKLFSYIINQTPESIVLLRSTFIDLLNFSEKVSPVFTPADVMDNRPLMDKISK
jgi:nitrous oxidase accessory protein